MCSSSSQASCPVRAAAVLCGRDPCIQPVPPHRTSTAAAGVTVSAPALANYFHRLVVATPSAANFGLAKLDIMMAQGETHMCVAAASAFG